MHGKKEKVSGKLQLSLHLMVDKGKLLGSRSNKNTAGEILQNNNNYEVSSVKPKVFSFSFLLFIYYFINLF